RFFIGGNMKFKITVLGREWEVLVIKPEEDERLNDCDGFTDWTALQIVIGDRREESTLEYPLGYLFKVMRHEIVHAFMFESGLAENWEHENGQDEMLVDWIAIQIHKIEEVCNDAESKLIKLICG
ncbi:MAG TPA: hypothetical protein DHV79_08920, partial [Lachnospiraceae bacterium]|nr:hypothetical protein [Lachnospiraceae bacterium]